MELLGSRRRGSRSGCIWVHQDHGSPDGCVTLGNEAEAAGRPQIRAKRVHVVH
jgi:hypothetical protein